MGFNIDKIPGINKIYKSFSVERKKETQEVFSLNGGKDELTISQKAMDYQIVNKGMKAIDQIPDIREDKVNDIKEKMDKGLYDVDGKDIAEKMMSGKFDKKI
ncbi:flagellar biosynthesis anti-sigma factor FlgM [Lutispora saccharofermentans]|uniref:Flagellar biosynthesis anti-sigma factor FlgM n=1 Tax=Lutispora saccharofermentans TaxID=3024236 RepID=A0ABT1ND81_9FIRM|nr:flagellar biosynthesis anti-sigma factor FlgM [Lutispora saccharofermentans]MCQ1528589.1 flagellar biosynthesis anti-sigma factor FlgM [Lutispora saccharofermentans]